MKIIITGTVQGVGFRPTVYRVANSLGLRGYVLNKGSYVEICIDRPQAVAKFLHTLKEELPPIASMNEIIVEEYEEEAGAWEDFKIIKSEEAEEELRSNLIPIPVDTSLCDACLKELFDKNNRRYLYPFTNCTVCGARFSVISDVPYDRERTSMREFKMCDACYEEYTDPRSRRFHAQTISCPNCGPSFKLYGKDRVLLEEKEPIKGFANILDEGYIGVAKGWGGMHILCRLEEETVKKFRSSYKRPEKPFAIMLRDLEVVKKYAEVNEFEQKLLLSAQKPIVLLDKKNNLLECISPGLPNLGIYLPYSAFHHVLFHYLKGDGVLMTSANIPGEPMIIDNEELIP